MRASIERQSSPRKNPIDGSRIRLINDRSHRAQIKTDARNIEQKVGDKVVWYAFTGNGHSLPVMSETNSRVISLTSRNSRGVRQPRRPTQYCRNAARAQASSLQTPGGASY